MTTMPLSLRSDDLDVVLRPDQGGAVDEIVHRPSGAQLLYRTSWGGRPGTVAVQHGPGGWLEHYRGGWHVLIPNGGAGCTFEGVDHGFHGEGSMAPFAVGSHDQRTATLEAELFTVPLQVVRTVTVDGLRVEVDERVTNVGAAPVTFMWVHHPGFGGELLEGPVQIDIAGTSVTTGDDPHEDAGERHSAWPMLEYSDGRQVDLSCPAAGQAVLAYVTDLTEGEARLRCVDTGLEARLSWDLDAFPYCWLWIERRATPGWPWYGRADVVGIEPASSWPGEGIAAVAARGGRLLTLAPGESRSATVAMTVIGPVQPQQPAPTQPGGAP